MQFHQLLDIRFHFSQKSPRLTMPKRFLLLSRSAATALNERSTKYELENAMEKKLPNPTREDISLQFRSVAKMIDTR